MANLGHGCYRNVQISHNVRPLLQMANRLLARSAKRLSLAFIPVLKTCFFYNPTCAGFICQLIKMEAKLAHEVEHFNIGAHLLDIAPRPLKVLHFCCGTEARKTDQIE